MDDAINAQPTLDDWGHENLGQAILDALVASGNNLEALTIDDLAPLHQFHGGGKAATTRLGQRVGLTPETRVLDVGGGLLPPLVAGDALLHPAMVGYQNDKTSQACPGCSCDETPTLTFLCPFSIHGVTSTPRVAYVPARSKEIVV